MTRPPLVLALGLFVASPAHALEYLEAAAGGILRNEVCDGPRIDDGEIAAWIYLGAMQQELSVEAAARAVHVIVTTLRPVLVGNALKRFCGSN